MPGSGMYCVCKVLMYHGITVLQAWHYPVCYPVEAPAAPSSLLNRPSSASGSRG